MPRVKLKCPLDVFFHLSEMEKYGQENGARIRGCVLANRLYIVTDE